ncbi:MAG: hypothetical protein M1819_005304 [Sarea resinae]|nr:MAG: hypothetical protein M1819_005304 [Sarea resinae]
MTSPSSPPSFPSSFDPALHLENEDFPPPIILTSESNAEELEAIRLQHEESIVTKNRQGTVIQHRAWKLGEAFRSEEDYHIDTPLSKRRRIDSGKSLFSTSSDNLPSSPPSFTMPSVSSPVAYPPSSPTSHPAKKTEELRKAYNKPENVSTKPQQRMLAGFLMDEEEEDGNDALEWAQFDAVTAADQARLGPPKQDTCPVELPKPVPGSKAKLGGRLSLKMDSVFRLPPVVDDPPRVEITSSSIGPSFKRKITSIRTCSGKAFPVTSKTAKPIIPFEELIASRSTAAPGRAKKSYYGIDIHQLLDEAKEADKVEAERLQTEPRSPVPSVESRPPAPATTKSGRTLMWTEKYRAKKFTDLVGDERTHRTVLRWLKGWDPIVFPQSGKPKRNPKATDGNPEERPHRKILLLTGPPGLGKTTLAHVCARQAGYEVLEINASDERSRDVVKGRIRDSVGTENVKGLGEKTANGKARKASRPVCVVVDEVDGVVGGGSGGEGGFVKALIDLVMLDQKNSNALSTANQSTASKRKKKGDNFRLLRPLILICNDVYHPALRPLRQSSLAEVVHIRKPPLNMVVARVKTIFEKEGFLCDGDGVRRLCEATWGISSRKEAQSNTSGSGEGDMRGVLVVGEWVAGRLRALSSSLEKVRLTRKWVEQNVTGDLSHGGGAARGLGRGGAKEVAERVFLEGAGFPKPINAGIPEGLKIGGKVGVAEMGKKMGMDRLREMADTSGEFDRVIADCFATYPTQPFQDDTILSKPNAAYDWLHFHDLLSSKVFSNQEWELGGYLSQSVLAFHDLFASPIRHSWSTGYEQKRVGEEEIEEPAPFTGLRAEFQAREAEKHNRATLLELQSALSISLLRSFRSPEDIAVELLPYLMSLLTPDVKPVIVGGSGGGTSGGDLQRSVASVRRESERAMVRRAVDVMNAVGVSFQHTRVETESGGGGRHAGFVYRMEPALDMLATYETASSSSSSVPTTTTSHTTSSLPPVRYAVRQVLDQEYQKAILQRRADARQARYKAGASASLDGEGEEHGKEKALAKQRQKGGPGLHGSVQNERERIGRFAAGVKRDFFGRVIVNEAVRPPSAPSHGGDSSDSNNEEEDNNDNTNGGGSEAKKRKRRRAAEEKQKEGHGHKDGDDAKANPKVWVSFHEGFSNAVRKPISLAELLAGL